MGAQSLTDSHRHSHAPLRIVLLLLLALASSPQAATQTIPAIAVPLILPSAIVFDTAGNLYLAETASHVIRRVDTAGNITTIAGTGTQGFSGDNGPAIAAQLDSPQGLALDSANNLYIADTHNHRIRKLNLTTGLIATIAGAGTPGFSGDTGPATLANLALPTALALDSANNLYLADTGNHRIRRIDAATGRITTTAGTGTQGFSGDNGPATAASIDSPQGLAFDSANNLYLADTNNHRIRRIAISTGRITTLAGTGTQSFSGDTGPSNAAAVALPHGLTIDPAGNLYLADTANHRIRRIDPTGVITTVAGTGTQGFSGDNGPATTASLDTPRSTILSPTALLTLADTGNQRIRQLEAPPTQQTIIHTVAGLATPTLTLTAPSKIVYGTGAITATLTASTAAIGVITFSNNSSPIGTSALTNNAATLHTSALPAGTYTITAIYAGDPNHLPSRSPVLTITILPAPTTTTLTNLVATAATTFPITSPSTFTSHVASTTIGSPTGTISLLDGSSPILTSPISATGDTAFTISSLAPGAHTLTALYNGAANFAPSASTQSSVIIGVGGSAPTGPDFTLTSTGTTTQTVVSGSSTTFNFSVQTAGDLASPINLTATGLPNFTTASFNPAYLPPGSINTFTLTIATPNTTASHQNHPTSLLWALLLFPVASLTLRPRNYRSKATLSALAILTLTLCSGCGDRVNTANSASATTTKTYVITVTGTATTATGTILQHTATVSLNLITSN
jgi:sugar lactone lactonase YvrE